MGAEPHTETERERPGPKRQRFLDWIPHPEYCGDCGKQIVWFERLNPESDKPGLKSMPQRKTRRFRRCCDCAAALGRRRG